MKTLKIALLIGTILLAKTSFSQNTLPTTGSVGINTLTPSATLDVNGNMIVDSSVVIKDSLHVQKKLIVDQDVKILGKSVFVDNVKAKNNLKVLGNANLQNNLTVDGLTKMNGNAKVFGNLKIMSLQDQNTTYKRLLSINPNGKIVAGMILKTGPSPGNNCVTVLPWTHAQSIAPNADPDDVVLCPNWGSIGIGTIVPQAKLDIEGSFRFANGSQSINRILVSDANGLANWRDASTVFNAWTINGQDIFRNVGKVGIGTNAPEDNLQVGDSHKKLVIGNAEGEDLGYGTSYIGFNASRTKAQGTWNTAGDTYHNGGAIIYGDINGNMRFTAIPNTGGTAQVGIADAAILNNTNLFISADGDVGIGTEKVYGFKLSVDGFVRARKVVVNLDTWADFVFDNEYKLKPLNEVEQYVNKNKHLPDVPSEKDVLENGIDLGKMNAVLLQKIEELTLYMIAQDKRIKQLENK